MASQMAVGSIAFYGLTPSINFFEQSGVDPTEQDPKDDREINVLLSECGDIRHILKTLSDILPLNKGPRKHPLNIYIHDRQLENLGRALVFLTLICEVSFAKRERMELFLDLYGNCLVREKSNAYLQSIVNELIQLVTEDDRCQSVLK